MKSFQQKRLWDKVSTSTERKILVRIYPSVLSVLAGYSLAACLGAAVATGLFIIDERRGPPPAPIVEHQDISPLEAEISQDVKEKVIAILHEAAKGAVGGILEHGGRELILILWGKLPPRTDAHKEFLDCVIRIGPDVLAKLALAIQPNGEELKSGEISSFELAEAKKCVEAYRKAAP